MLHPYLAKVPLVALTAVSVVFVLAMSAKMGATTNTLTIEILVILFAGLAWLYWSQKNRYQQRDRHTRQLRFIAERFQAMVRTMPCGYCLFTPQGLLREEFGVAERLGVKKVAHLDDLVAALREGPELVQAFRSLEQTGKDFTLNSYANISRKDLHITGRRFRIGKDGPQIDVLWFGDASTAKQPAEIEEIKAASVKKAPPEETQALMDAMPLPVWCRSTDLRIVRCNKAYARAQDVSIAEVLNDQLELMSHTARGGSGRSLAAKAQDQNAPQKERRHVIIAGKRRLLEITERPFRFAEDKNEKNTQASVSDAIELMGFAIDVTVEEEKDTELQRHLVAHHEIMEHLGSAIAIYGADTSLEFYNRAYQRLWETEEAFLDGKPTFAEVLEDLRTRRRIPEQTDFQRYKKERIALFTSLLEPHEDLMVLPDGTTLRVLAVPHPFGGIMFVHENVTDKLALESSYNTLIAVQRETLDNLSEGIAVFGPDGKLRLYNPAFARVWKLEAEFLLSEPHISDLLEVMKPLFNFGTNWAEFKSEMVGYTLDRNPRKARIERVDQVVIEFLTVPLPDGAVLNSYLDVSDSVRVEQALRASNAALATADRLKSDFVANVSYQLRTPLSTIAGFADILAEQYFGTLNEKQLEYTATIKAESEKLSHLINDVLDLATIEAGRMALDLKRVAIADLLNEAKQMTAEWARQQSLEIIIDCPSTIGGVDVDKHRMKQVLFNLIGNAIKYTPAGGRITLMARRQDSWVNLSVIDTGVGIPEADRERVFGKFERANPQVRQSGSGLGLSLVKSFVELHGGRVEIASEAKQGTRITCFIPEHASNAANKEA